MFRALLAHPHEALHKCHLVYCMRIMSAGCGTVAVKLQPCQSIFFLSLEQGTFLSADEDCHDFVYITLEFKFGHRVL
jgi:hypothetical protein